MKLSPRLAARLWQLIRRHPIAVLAATALAFRLSTITWGIGLGPFSGWYHPDESKAWRSVVGFPGNYWSNRTFIYGTALQYTVGAVLFPFKQLWQSGHPLLPSITYLQFAVLVDRAAHAVLGAATVALIYRLGLRLWDEATALLAAALLTVCFYHVLDSALTTLDVPMGFLVTLGMLLAARAAHEPTVGRFVGLGAVLGYLTGTKITGASLVVVPIAMTITAPPAERRRWIAGTAIAVVVAAAVFGLTTPHAILNLRAYLDFMGYQRAVWLEAAGHTPLAIAQAWLRALSMTLLPPVAALALVGIGIGRATPAARRVEGAILAYLGAQVLIWRGYLPPRFLLPVLPILCAYAARALVLASTSPRAGLRRAAPVLTALVVVSSLTAALAGIWTRWMDVRTEAARDIAHLVPPGSTLGFATTRADAWTDHRWRFPAVDTTRNRISATLDRPSFLLLSDWTLVPMQRALASGQLGPGYVWPESLATVWYHRQVPTPEEFRFFEELLGGRSDYRLVAHWKPATPLPVEFSDRGLWLYRRP